MHEERERLGRKAFARSLRKDMTDAELYLWAALRNRRFRQYKFRRQVPIGAYVVDFLCMAHHLALEVDGPIHEKRERKEYDRNRDACLWELGCRTLRFKNEEIMTDLPSVLCRIEQAILQPAKQQTFPLLRKPDAVISKQTRMAPMTRTEKGARGMR
ncbi:MAG: endonuclease domain-containing protein [Candidatus Peribacteraceae bacterium]